MEKPSSISKGKWFTKDVFNWSLFDFANSTFATIVVAFVFAIYFKKVVANNQPVADLYWSTAINISMLLVAFLSPVLGAASDYYGNKKKYLIFFTFLCIASTSLLYFITEGMVLWGMILFILANIGFQSGLGFYDAFIKEIAEFKNYNKVSSLGYAVGYLGSLASLAAVIVLQDEPRMTFIACAVMFFIFSLPMFLFVKEKAVDDCGGLHNSNFLTTGIKRTLDTIKHINSYSNIRLFLISYFLYIDGVNTIIFFSANYAQTTLNFEIPDLILFFIIVQVTALAGSFLFGWIADRIGTKKTILFIILSWAVLTLMVFFADTKMIFLIIGAFAGTFLGSSQALSRSFMSRITPDEKKTEFFGFYSLFEKTSTILGPLTFGLVSWLTGNQRYAIISILIFFISGYLVFRRVKEETKNPAVSGETTG
ncbi:MAG: MFS transporter [Ignavibacteria bacterium]|nr:MFS transporter [Ignavibacteria bacterium]MCC7159759.1 MFS transporter [Ignavibacteria bacterium]